MKTVSFMMTWEMSGRQTIDLPDEIDPNDKDAVREYIQENWDDIPLPTDGDYIADSDTLDEESGFDIRNWDDDGSERVYINPVTDLPSAICGPIKVDWVNLNEGYSGDYNPKDPEDVNLLRFDVYGATNGKWEALEGGSYCTRMPADTSIETLKKAALLIAQKCASAIENGESLKRTCEQLSWFEPEWVENN